MGSGSSGQDSNRTENGDLQRQQANGGTGIPPGIARIQTRFPNTTTVGWYASESGPVWYALHHGDGIELLRSLPAESVHQIATDIPYDEVNQPTNGLRSLDKGNADVLTFSLDTLLAECIRVLQGSFYSFCGYQQLSDYIGLLREHDLRSIRSCVWYKPRPSTMNAQHQWLSALEHCVFARKPGAKFYARGGANVWRFPTARGKERIVKVQKPQALMQYLIRASSRPGHLVADPCLGSGSTGVAALTLGRHFIGAELDGDMYKVAVQRIRTLSAGQSPATLPEEYEKLLI